MGDQSIQRPRPAEPVDVDCPCGARVGNPCWREGSGSRTLPATLTGFHRARYRTLYERRAVSFTYPVYGTDGARWRCVGCQDDQIPDGARADHRCHATGGWEDAVDDAGPE